jgi:hypothetical protein
LCPDADIIYSGLILEHEADGSTSSAPGFPAGALWQTLLYRNTICPSTVLARRDFLIKVPFTPGRKGCEDWDCWVRAYRAGARFACVTEPLAYYRDAPGSVSSSAERMLADFHHILEPTLLAGMDGWSRWSWRRRIIASQFFSAAMIERTRHNLHGEWKYLLQSMAEWPSPLFRTERFRAVAYRLFKGAMTSPDAH